MRTPHWLRALVCAVLLGAVPLGTWTAPPPAEAQSAARADAPAQVLVAPGQGIGSVRLGMRMQDVIATLGTPQSAWTFLDGRRVYRWFQPPGNSGLGVGADVTGIVDRVWALNDARYSTSDGLHPGSTEAQIMQVMGKPTESVFDAQLHLRKLFYVAQGVWFSVQLDQRYAFYNQVFEIGVATSSASFVQR